MTPLVRIFHALLIAALLAAGAPGLLLAQTATPTALPVETPAPTPTPDAAKLALDAQIDALLAQMSIADRVGQLFLITFQGNDTGFESDIAELIYGYRVGGVVLSARNGNFSNEKGIDTPAQVATLVNQLQALAFGVLLPTEQALPETWPETWPAEDAISLEQATAVPPVNVPLFVAVEQAGDSLPATALRREFTPLPSEMALGATWNPDLANQVGQIVGRELTAVGVNLLLGPNLDVLEQPRPDLAGGLGIYSFGGDPYWVSQMGRAYIAGVHGGSGGRLATVARHFPGAGDADRLQDQEVATVQRSAEEMRRVALPPFLAVTRSASSVLSPNGDAAATDALMSSHIRYSGFQGGSLGRNTPISLAPELGIVLEQEGFADWHAQGGLMVSGMLGAPAIRRHYDPSLAEFPYRRVATDAFSAGHDLLYLGRFSLDDHWESEKQNLKETIGYFQDRYGRDRDFAGQVDAAVRRILRLKLRLYGVEGTERADGAAGAQAAPAVDPTQVLVNAAGLAVLEEENRTPSLAVVGQVARDSFTVLYPDPANASDIAAMTPQPGDRILIFSDSRLQQECENCMAEAAVGPDALAAIIERLYGPAGTGQVQPDQINSMAFSDLAQLLDTDLSAVPLAGDAGQAVPTSTPTITPTLLLTPAAPPGAETDTPEGATPLLPGLDKNAKTSLLIDEADWILFAMLDVDPVRYPTSDVVKSFLRQRGSQLANKHLAVLALHAPYFLDATEISKLNGYYATYSKTQPFLESAVRALFRAFSPIGAPPVSVPGTRFGNLAERLQPDPAQIVDLLVSVPDGSVLIDTSAAASGSIPEVDAGQMIRVQAGPVLDRNGKIVRNGTPVELRLTDDGSAGAPVVETATTQNGLATRDLVLNRPGVVQITARAGQAVSPEDVALSVLGPATVSEAIAPSATSNEAVSAAAGLTVAALMTTAATSVTTTGVNAAPPVTVVPESPAAAGRRIDLVSLAVALLTMIAMSSLLLIVQVRVLPRQALVHGILWAINCGLLGYILYGLGLIPGGRWLENSLHVWGSGLVVFIAMLLPLVWLQLRAE
ncbi:MAG: hypothetical protein IT329_09050 [Caldilineaceae bacterium]|nr:hypothetical protein [Caldilineaceae bacterium]